MEVDGDIHDLQKEEDERREKVLSALGLRIVRFGNDEVGRDLSAVVGKIREFIIHPCSFGGATSLKSMATSTTCRKRKMNGGRRCCLRWG